MKYDIIVGVKKKKKKEGWRKEMQKPVTTTQDPLWYKMAVLNNSEYM